MNAIVKGVFIKNKEFKQDNGEIVKSAVILSDEDKITIYGKHFNVAQFSPVQCECIIRVKQDGSGFSCRFV